MALTVTEKAAAEILRIVADQGLDQENTFLRLGVKGGGCSGFQYSLDLTDDATDGDERFDSNGIGIVCDRRALPYLDGTEVDFSDGLMGRGFVFNNPNATHGCGCGSSFSASPSGGPPPGGCGPPGGSGGCGSPPAREEPFEV